MIIKFRPTFAYVSLIYILLIACNPGIVKAGQLLSNKSASTELPAQLFCRQQLGISFSKQFSKLVIVSVCQIAAQDTRGRYFLVTQTGILVEFILITGILVFGCNQYRKRRMFLKKLKQIEGDMEDQRLCLQRVTKENEWLVEELHHRVKNNLQIVISLLDSQAGYLTHQEAIQAVKSSQHRMYAISLVHQKLYQTESLAIINMEAYINDLLQYLQDEYPSNRRVSLVLKTIPLKLNLSTAIPLGLIINEAVSNILQYAFPKHGRGEINLTLAKDDQEHYVLRIADNGIGLPPEFNAKNPNSLGTILMTGLSQQIHADLDIKNINGVIITLRFKNKPSQTFPLSA